MGANVIAYRVLQFYSELPTAVELLVESKVLSVLSDVVCSANPECQIRAAKVMELLLAKNDKPLDKSDQLLQSIFKAVGLSLGECMSSCCSGI